MMAEVKWTKKKPIRNLSSQVPSTASLATVRSPAPDAGTINEQVFLSFNKYLSLAQLGILVWDNHRGGQAPQSYLLNEKLDWILKNVFVRFSGWCSPWELTRAEQKRWASGLVFNCPSQLLSVFGYLLIVLLNFSVFVFHYKLIEHSGEQSGMCLLRRMRLILFWWS